jgi:hypothetical protein
VNGIQQILIAEWLSEEFNGSRLLGPHRHGDIAVARDKTIGMWMFASANSR